MKKYLKKIIFILLLIWIIFVIFFFSLNCKIENNYKNQIFEVENIPKSKVWLVLWAWVKNNNLSDIFRDRLDTALKAYKSWKIEKILVSWDNWRENYDEITPAKNYLFENQVKKDDIFLDYAWFDTYSSLYRAKEIFWNSELNIFTQNFHLPRALYICEWLKIKCNWVKSDLHTYVYINYYKKREKLSRIKAFLNLLFNSKPKFLGEKISMDWKSNFE